MTLSPETLTWTEMVAVSLGAAIFRPLQQHYIPNNISLSARVNAFNIISVTITQLLNSPSPAVIVIHLGAILQTDTPDEVAESVEHRLPMQKVESSIPGRVPVDS